MQTLTGGYTGDGVDNRWITVGFAPDFVYVKGDAAEFGHFRTSDMSSDECIAPYRYTGLLSNRIQDFDATRFQIGTDDSVNKNGESYYWVAVRDDGSSDFAVGTYTGDGTDDRNINSGWQPTAVIIAGENSDVAVWRVNENSGDDTLHFRNLADVTNRIQAFNASGFQVGSDADVNKSGLHSRKNSHYTARIYIARNSKI